ncbi:hypothetical protein Poli38472_014271 [Pythium oligandrum]|uniref:Uncharacterized protein n=1 Tax=Pythium oligandrum TaxID=41045 RepID=A0A8K1FKG0_PYTOL|nr:hypothetical protein Poli38472_014271 [Pythium oligandrum]|eukprot:TMW64154.1 hypothetical protein Poli38472_014271 [Pythium oligandrum]
MSAALDWLLFENEPDAAFTSTESNGSAGGESPIKIEELLAEPTIELDEKERKRLRHREYVKKSYRKKISTIQTLRDQLDTLERDYHSMLGKRDNELALPAPTATNNSSPLMQKYFELTEIKNRLQRENEHLYAANAEFMKAEGRFQQLLDSDIQFPLSQPRFYISKLPPSDYAKIIADARDDVLKFAYAKDTLSTGYSVFGWTDKRKVTSEEIKFALVKDFPKISAYDLLMRCWGIFTIPERFSSIYNPGFITKFYPLQTIDDDTQLLFRTIQIDGMDFITKTVFLLARIKIDEGYLILFKSIDKDSVQFRESEINSIIEETRAIVTKKSTPKREMWVDKYIWIVIEDKGFEGCAFHFGGAATTNIWIKEVLFIALRWENLAVGPQFTLAFN